MAVPHSPNCQGRSLLGDLEIVMNRAARFFLGLTVVGFLAAMTALPGDKRTSGERAEVDANDPFRTTYPNSST